ncbi:MAG TPA: MBL fold metallo-hydrolase [Caulobacterales bacterium]|nr:MBL fold metallo-hydrolase [Caulobacterales bacterium]
MKPDVHAFFHEATNTVTYLVVDPATRAAALIDSVLDFEPANGKLWRASIGRVLDAATALDLDVRWILETHVHADHLSAAHVAHELTGAPTVIGDRFPETQALFAKRFLADDITPEFRAFDRLVRDGEILPLGAQSIRVMRTPGHTSGCVTYIIDDAAFIGDTMFMPDYGTARTDFPGGDAAALYHSIRHILALPPETRLFVCHDYKGPGREAFAWQASVAEQNAHNVQISADVDEASFVAARRARDAALAPPRLLLPALQVNIRGGRLPPPDRDGVVRLRLPVSQPA